MTIATTMVIIIINNNNNNNNNINNTYIQTLNRVIFTSLFYVNDKACFVVHNLEYKLLAMSLTCSRFYQKM